MECKKLANDLKEVENGRESVEEEDERKLPTWMIKSEPDETNQNDEEEAPNSPTASSSARANVEDSKPEIAASTSVYFIFTSIFPPRYQLMGIMIIYRLMML